MPPRLATPKEVKAELENRKASALSLSPPGSQIEFKEVRNSILHRFYWIL